MLHRRVVGIIFICVVSLATGCPGPANQRGPELEARQQAGDQQPTMRATPKAEPEMSESERLAFISKMKPQVDAFCGDCHATSPPSSSTKEDWIAEVKQGFLLYRTSGRNDLEAPNQDLVLKYFQCQAPTTFDLTRSIDNYPATPVTLDQTSPPIASGRSPAVTNVQWVESGIGDASALIYCDIATGGIKAYWPSKPEQPPQTLGTVFQPVHVQPCDLNQDQALDLIVADIGEFNANESDLGQVVWLRQKPAAGEFERVVLLEGLSRIADVREGDFDSDGDTDLLVAAFGWRKTGRIFLMVNQGTQTNDVPDFEIREVDPRHGAVHVPPADLNADGHLDFVALISQEHEVVEAFLNDGTGNFQRQEIWNAPDPAYGSSGIELVDLDGDNDLDVLMTNGDSFDRGAKPYHSVQWLENQGAYPFVHHHLCTMPGVMSARAADFDADGDLDVVATALLVGTSRTQLDSINSSSVVMLMQDAPGEFRATQVEAKSPQHLAITVGDFDHDGKPDFAAGNFLRQSMQPASDLLLWWNRSKSTDGN